MKKIVLTLVAIAGLVAAALFLQTAGPRPSLHIVSGSENEALEPLVRAWAEDNRVDLEMSYLGSVDISRELNKGTATEYDAVWPAHSLWIELGDTSRVVKHDASALRSPVVLGLRKSIAEDLGWTTRDDVTVQEIAQAARDGKFRLSMTSATQSNSGASAYFGFLYALADNPDVLTLDTLAEPGLQDALRDLLAQVDRSSGSSGWLKNALVGNYDSFDAMFNYEALVIEGNQTLVDNGQEPLYTIYPANGLSVADSPLGYVDKGDTTKEEAFLALQAYLQGDEATDLLTGLGRRAGLIGLGAGGTDRSVWNPDWGIDLDRSIAPIPTPSAEVIGEALRLYQSELRKPSLTVWVLDTSGSMEGEPIAQLKQAMGLLLDPEAAAVNLLQPSSRDVTIILPFNHEPAGPTIVQGTAQEDLQRALTRVDRLDADGGTDLYRAIGAALGEMEIFHLDGTLFDYLPAIVAMTDGASDDINRQWLLAQIDSSPFARDVPIHSIAFGNADEAQLDELSRLSIGRRFTAGGDLAGALRKAKGYN